MTSGSSIQAMMRRALGQFIEGGGRIALAALGGCHPGTVSTVRCKNPMVSSQVDARFRHQRGELGNEVRGFENHMCGAVAIRGFELVAHLATGRERQASLGNGGACDVSAQAFQFPVVVPPGGHSSV